MHHVSFRTGTEPPGTTDEQVWYAKQLYQSAFHPDSGEKYNLIGSMSFQVPGGMAITGCMMQFYKWGVFYVGLLEGSYVINHSHFIVGGPLVRL